jgi:hypothetical protein
LPLLSATINPFQKEKQATIEENIFLNIQKRHFINRTLIIPHLFHF